MSLQVKYITFEGKLDVWGIYNYNAKKDRKDPDSNQWYKNNIGAKIFKIKIDKGLEKEIDYTSSRCIRHEIFKDIQPRQPSSKAFANQFIQMVASEVGLLRGYLSPDEKGDSKDIKGLKRCSPLHIADAQTIDDVKIVFDQGSSSKPKEEGKAQGKDKGDIAMFSKDNAPYRQQKLLGGINLKELQFLSLYGVDNDFAMISKNRKDEFVSLLKEYFKKHGVNETLEVKDYVDIAAVYKTPRTGILLNQEQIRHLVKVVFQRIKMINGLKAGARLAYQKGSLKVSFFDGEDPIDVGESDLKEELSNMHFHHFFKTAA